ncbi:MAG: flavodoxin domain-containing protein [Gaiellaceae bacterium]
MGMKILVAWSSRHGATRELADMLATTISEQGIAVDVRRMEDVDTVFPYDGLVLGSAVYMGRWTPEARAFVEEHAGGIVTRPTWLFSSGPIGDYGGADPFDAADLMRATGAREHHLFGGRLEKSTLGLRERAFARMLHVPAGDFREWAAAAAWATAIARTLTDLRAA